MTYKELQEVWRFAEYTHIFAPCEDERAAAWKWIQDHKVQLITQVDVSILTKPREAQP